MSVLEDRSLRLEDLFKSRFLGGRLGGCSAESVGWSEVDSGREGLGSCELLLDDSDIEILDGIGSCGPLEVGSEVSIGALLCDDGTREEGEGTCAL